jgi:hypothetical protein
LCLIFEWIICLFLGAHDFFVTQPKYAVKKTSIPIYTMRSAATSRPPSRHYPFTQTSPSTSLSVAVAVVAAVVVGLAVAVVVAAGWQWRSVAAAAAALQQLNGGGGGGTAAETWRRHGGGGSMAVADQAAVGVAGSATAWQRQRGGSVTA